jgi:O-antigen ligase
MTAAPALSRLAGLDGATALTVLLVALVAIPSDLIVGPLGSAGTPAQIIGMALFAGWAVMTVGGQSRSRHHRREPIRAFAWVFAIAIVFSYIAANSRAMLPAEAHSADAGLLVVCSWMGIFLTATDRIRSRARLDVLLRRFVLLAGALATLGVLQFLTRTAYTNYIQIPGLATNQSLVSLYGRNGHTRPAGTAVHPIEFGAILTMTLPLALHYALVDARRSFVRRWYPVAAIAFAVPLSISRSAVLSVLVVLCLVMPTWTTSLRRRAYLAILAITSGVYLIVPGLLGTITGLFTGISGDGSAKSRTNSYSLAFEFISRSPMFGRGFFTFLPAYRILDNEYLGLLIETGFVGLVAFLGLLLSGISEGLRNRREARSRHDASLGVALAASVASALASFALFDAFAFPMAASSLFLMLGCISALHQLRSAELSRRTTSQWTQARSAPRLGKHLPGSRLSSRLQR